MNRFSKTQIYLHWITLLFVAITYAAMELRGWFPKGSSTYLLITLQCGYIRLGVNVFTPDYKTPL
ncbi:hypothetical protein MZ16F87_30710 [Escherichia coli]|nr:cytochrome [Escherichia coli]